MPRLAGTSQTKIKINIKKILVLAAVTENRRAKSVFARIAKKTALLQTFTGVTIPITVGSRMVNQGQENVKRTKKRTSKSFKRCSPSSRRFKKKKRKGAKGHTAVVTLVTVTDPSHS